MHKACVPREVENLKYSWLSYALFFTDLARSRRSIAPGLASHKIWAPQRGQSMEFSARKVVGSGVVFQHTGHCNTAMLLLCSVNCRYTCTEYWMHSTAT